MFSSPPQTFNEPPQTYDNVIPDTGYNYDSYTDSLNKYSQYEVAQANQYVAPTPKPQPVKINQQSFINTRPVVQNQYNGNNKLTDYTFSSFGFGRQQNVVTTPAPAPVYNFATTPRPTQRIIQQHQQQQQQQPIKQHSAFYTYNWDSLFKNYYSYNNGRK